jgi:S-formylglutathione hydrolase FrmB
MKTHLLVLFIFCLGLLGCQPAASVTPEPSPTVWACNEPGTILRDTLEAPARGYAYRFHIYLPPCYDSDTQREYPVLYLLPGHGGSSGNWFNAGADQVADDLILSGQVAPFIIVCTESPDTDPHGEIIATELAPYVESNYRVLTGRQHHAVAGGSRGGIGAYRMAFQHPEQFASAGLFGSGVVPGEEDQVRVWLQSIPAAERPRLFFNTGFEDPLMLAQAKVMITLLDEAGFESTTLFTTGEHSYAYWVSNLGAYFQWLAQDWD